MTGAHISQKLQKHERYASFVSWEYAVYAVASGKVTFDGKKRIDDILDRQFEITPGHSQDLKAVLAFD